MCKVSPFLFLSSPGLPTCIPNVLVPLLKEPGTSDADLESPTN